MTSQAKKPRLNNKKRSYYQHQNNSNRRLLEIGQQGFFVTCNFRESECIRESYNILNFYADKMYGASEMDKSNNIEDEHVELNKDLDIADKLENKVESINNDSKGVNKFRFIALDTGAKNCLFIKTELPNPIELGTMVVRDIAETKVSRTRHLLRFIPIEVICKANLTDIIEAAGSLFDKYFLEGNKSFAIVYKKRYNNNINRDDIITSLADLVTKKNITNKVNLSNPKLSIIVELVKSKCCMSVLEDYIKFKKYNLAEIVSAEEDWNDLNETADQCIEARENNAQKDDDK